MQIGIDLGATNISANSNNVVSGLRIKLGASAFTETSGSTQDGLRIKLGDVNFRLQHEKR